MRGSSILFSEMRPQSDWEDKFNHWYDKDHIPIRMSIDGFVGAQRYKSREDENYLAVYDMASLDVLKTAAYQKVKDEPSKETRWMLKNVSNFTRYLGNELGWHGDETATEAPLLYAVMFNVPADAQPEFDRWMTEEHAPMLLREPLWRATRRFHLTAGEPMPFTRLAIHYLASPDALKSPERHKARGTAWRDRLSKNEWFGSARYKIFDRWGPRYRGVRQISIGS